MFPALFKKRGLLASDVGHFVFEGARVLGGFVDLGGIQNYQHLVRTQVNKLLLILLRGIILFIQGNSKF